MIKILFVLLLAMLLAGCTRTSEPPVTAPPKPTMQEVTLPVATPTEESLETKPIYGEAQLLGDAEDQEAAEKLAELYGITLVKYKNGLARFRTEEDPRDVIRRGKDNGWPELVLNRTNSLF